MIKYIIVFLSFAFFCAKLVLRKIRKLVMIALSTTT